MRTAAYRGGGVMPHVYMRTCTLFMFLAAFLTYSVLFYLLKFNLTFIQNNVFVRKANFSTARSISVGMKSAFYSTYNYFCAPNLSKAFFILIK